MAGVFLIVLMLMGSGSSYATQASQKSFIGCFNRLPDGALQFGAVPSGELFTLRGQTNLAEEHVDQLVRVFGDLDRREPDHGATGTLTIHKVQALAGSCTSALPATKLEGVPGKVGEDTVAVPVTGTSTEDQTTPGFQTGDAAGRPARTQAWNGMGVEAPAAPQYPEQVGQSEAAANMDAKSVERTEILPGTTLGVGGSATGSEGVARNSKPNSNASTKSKAAPVE